jgi:hypothetical protein
MVGIPTVYNGIQYRSRLEARWAAFFDQLGWPYTYEPFDAHGYIPDFLIHWDTPVLVEVKPAVAKDDYLDTMDKITIGLSDWPYPVLIAGTTPLTVSDVNPVVPLLGYLMWRDGIGNWVCSQSAIGLLDNGLHVCRLDEPPDSASLLAEERVRAFWNPACNTVQWLPREEP